LFAAPQIADDLGNLDDVTRRKLFQVRLVTARPVGGLFHDGVTKYGEYALQARFVNDIANADHLNVVGWNFNGEVSLGDAELEVLLLFAHHHANLDFDDACCTVVRVHDCFAYFERHLRVFPSPDLQFYHSTRDPTGGGTSPTPAGARADPCASSIDSICSEHLSA